MTPLEGPPLASILLGDLFSKRKALKRGLASRAGLQPLRIAVLSGTTTQEVVELLELWLLDCGFRPTFYQSEFGRFHTEAVHDRQTLEAFRPDLVYIHTSVHNLQCFPSIDATEACFHQAIQAELTRFREAWNSLGENLGCLIVQPNFELPAQAVLGNLDTVLPAGHTRFVLELNRRFAEAAGSSPRLRLHDIASLSARFGLDRWWDPSRWFLYKIPTTPEASNALAASLASLVSAAFGRARKVLVLDLDNTIWGGVVGDDGPDHLHLGRETPLAEAHTAFGEYCLRLRDRGILLAVCSKNDEATARQGLAHRDSVLRLEHLAAFRANWNPKPSNLLSIAEELNLPLDALVFADDNPAERALVAAQLPAVAVPDIGSDPALYPARIEAGRYFEPLCLSREDLTRATLYRSNADRAAALPTFETYEDYLASLEMTAEIEPFTPMYLDRITQLTNKTNQFNLSTRRYTLAEIESILADPSALHLCGRLSDRFGDNGLVSVVLGRPAPDDPRTLDIDLWLMSCRVLKRDMEFAMLDELVAHARDRSIRTLRGTYVPTGKNSIVVDHYTRLGFRIVATNPDGSATYTLDLAPYHPQNRHIRVHSLALAEV